MLFSTALIPIALTVIGAVASPLHFNKKRTVSADVYADLVYYFKYASSAYSEICLYPNGNTLVEQVCNAPYSSGHQLTIMMHVSFRIWAHSRKVSLLVTTPARKSWSQCVEAHRWGISSPTLS